MRVFMAGGTGVLGRATTPKLIEAGHEVLAVSRRAEADAALRAVGAAPMRLDLFDRDAVVAAAHGADAVVNIATRIPSIMRSGRAAAWEDNHRLRRDASRNLAEAAIRCGARFIQESFAPTYAANGSAWITEPHPLDAAAQTATVPAAEASAELVTDTGGTGVTLRFGLFYSAGNAHTRWVLSFARRGWLFLPGPEERYTSMVYVDDAAAAVVAALMLPAGVYNVVDDEPLTLAAHAAALGTLLGREPPKLLPAWVARIPTMQVLGRSHRISNAKLRAASGWRPEAPSVRRGWEMILQEVAREVA